MTDKFPPRVILYDTEAGVIETKLRADDRELVYISEPEHTAIVEKLESDNNDHLIKVKAIIEYCEPHLEQMWAARVIGILLGCDFRDVKDHIESFYEYIEEIGL